MTQPTPRCTTCRRPSPQPICDTCRTDTRRNLHQLPTLLIKLVHHLPPTNTTSNTPIGRAAFTSRPPLSTNVLNLLVGPTTGTGRGLLAIPTWTATWATLWRARNGHHPPTDRQIAVRWNTTNQLYPPKDDTDPNAHTWDARFGRPTGPLTLRINLTYLTTWLEPACDTFDDTHTFITQLKTLTSVGSATVGEPSEAHYLGQCPEPVLDRRTKVQKLDDDGNPEWCGARIWHQPDQGTTVTCPRCRTSTSETGWFRLALRMRDVWGTVGTRTAWGR